MSSGYLNQEQRNVELQKPRLVVRIIEARGLKSADFNGYSDPYCEVRIKDQVVHHKTKVCKKTLNPFWNEEFILNPADLERDILLVKIYDWDANTSDDLLGEMEYPVHLFVNKAPVEEWKQVMDKKGPGRFVTGTGELKMMVTLYNSNQPLFFSGPASTRSSLCSGLSRRPPNTSSSISSTSLSPGLPTSCLCSARTLSRWLPRSPAAIPAAATTTFTTPTASTQPTYPRQSKSSNKSSN